MNFYSVDVFKMCVSINIIVLLLNADLSVIIVLTSEQEMVGWLNLEIVARS